MNNKWPRVLLPIAGMLAWLVASCGLPASTTAATSGSSNTAAISPIVGGPGPTSASTPPADPYKLTILHTSENHGHWTPVEVSKVSEGGIARRATLVRELRAETPNTLLLDSGDISQGTLYFTQYKGAEGRDFYNLLGYDAVVTGNHDFDLGPKSLADNLLTGAKFSMVAANMDFSREPELAGKIQPAVIKTVGGERIGIFGLVTEETAITSSPGPNVKVMDPTQAARDAVAKLSAQGVNKIVLLSHLGFPADRELASEVPGIDVIVSGHTETLMGDPAKIDASLGRPSLPYPVSVNGSSGGPTLIVHAFTWGRLLGRLGLIFNAAGEIVKWEGEPIFINSKISDDPVVAQKLADLAKPLDELKKQVIGQTLVDLDGRRSTVRNQESNLGNMVADATLWATTRDKTQIALVNGGGMRASIPAGDISIAQVMEALPYGNRLVQIDLTGADVIAALENGVSMIETDAEKSAGRFLQVGGLKFIADLSQPVGSRIAEVQVGTAVSGYVPIDKGATYRVVTLDFMYGGGDGYTMLKNGQNTRGGDVPEEQAVIEYIKSHSPVSPQVEGRIALAR